MTKIKPYQGTIVRNGTGLQVTIPQHIVRYMDLEKGDKLNVELTIVDKKGNIKKKENVVYGKDTRDLSESNK